MTMLADMDLEKEINRDSDESDANNDKKPLVLTNAFDQMSHFEAIEGKEDTDSQCPQSWRMKDRMKTVSVALVLCLNVGVDPPDIIKPNPCSVLQSWIDPFSLAPQKALEAIGNNLMKQYERWQPRARYKQSLDPTVDDVKKLCTSLRRNAKDERVLFHYNGHGVPKPTVNGEIWVFNRSYTQYIPLSVYDLQQWMGSPSIYVFECSNAGIIVDSFSQFAIQHEKEYELNLNTNTSTNGSPFHHQMAPNYKNCILLAACAKNELLPMHPDLPADLFTSCLTTPIKIALRWFVKQRAGKLVPAVNYELLDKIPGLLTDRRTMLGELNWIFTAITDTIAWNTLPRDLFQRLFRQDLLVASLFRNFLLAERIMRTYDCTPISFPALPPAYHHSMWNAWDLAVDLCLSQLIPIVNEEAQYRHSQFFSEQLTAFEVWLKLGARPDRHPEQLPIVLQVLLSQVHRSRALDLLGRFLDLGPWAVHLALSVGIFPYVLKLLQSSARELRPLLVFIWAKVLAVDQSCQADLVRDNGHRYFLSVLSDQHMPEEYRTMAAFVMACIVKNHPAGQEAALQGNTPNGNLIDHCLEQLQMPCGDPSSNSSSPLLRQWLALCLGFIWENFEKARWSATRNTAHDKLFMLLEDPVPQVRAAAVYALGTFINSATERTDHANALDHNIAITLINKCLNDSSPLVRKELLVALHWLVLIFENCFLAIMYQKIDEERLAHNTQMSASAIGYIPGETALTPPTTSNTSTIPMKRVNSSNSLHSYQTNSSVICQNPAIPNVFVVIWKAITFYANDPYPEVAAMATIIIDEMKSRIFAQNTVYDSLKESNSMHSLSEPNSPNNTQQYMSESPTSNTGHSSRNTTPVRESLASNRFMPSLNYKNIFSAKRHIFGREPSVSDKSQDGNTEDMANYQREPLISTPFVDWCIKHFSQPSNLNYSQDLDTESNSHYEKVWKCSRNKNIEEKSKRELLLVDSSHIDEQIFHQRNVNSAQHLAFHPYDNRLIIGERDSFSVWSYDSQPQQSYYSYNNFNPVLLGTHSNINPLPSRITGLKLINTHDLTQLMTSCDDGSIRVWKDFTLNDKSEKIKLVTAFYIFNDMQPNNKNGVIFEWNQWQHKLIASGEPRVIRLWDADKEMKIRDMNTGADKDVTSLSTDNSHYICVGYNDGSVRVFDDRLMPHDSRVHTFYDNKGYIVNAHIYPYEDGFLIISGSSTGDIKWFDKRNATHPIKSINTGLGMTAMTFHLEANVFACGLGNQPVPNSYPSINLYTFDGLQGNTIRYYDRFISNRLSPICSLAFHPLKARLAVGTTDNLISIYRPSKRF
ncbi:regulatory-associated protein of mTOR-like isoform X2 [Oppia nitens]|uniref:regulatory-associated protein of mTOR-like isoform X2 n=1 Tax=Oppia nitens TaxID=1686743 RepID=UPI0023DCD47C|nr:regulatory-associated protein of mTOR-like isoform X2 [Oppia nitens]